MEVYLDNAATTRVCPEAADIAYKVMTECYGNPSSTHTKGREAQDLSRHCTLADSRSPRLLGIGGLFHLLRLGKRRLGNNKGRGEQIPPRKAHNFVRRRARRRAQNA